jgi:hypothetical protein
MAKSRYDRGESTITIEEYYRRQGNPGDQGDEEDALEALKRREGSGTRRWRDMVGNGPEMMAETPPATERPRRRLVRVGNQPRSEYGVSLPVINGV